jgi:hypothetical protein
MRFLFLFLDGVGLGEDNPQANPFAKYRLPNLEKLLGGRRLLAKNAPIENERAALVALDACLGVQGYPQSATGQATLVTGKNVPEAIGRHYGPKPNPPVAEILKNGNLFSALKQRGLQAALLNAYPPGYFEAIHSGRRLFSAIPLAVNSAGIPLKTAEDLYSGQSLAADFTARGWHDRLGLRDAPVLSPLQAGQRLCSLAGEYDFAFFEYWLSDYAGHRRDMAQAQVLLEDFDQVLEGLLLGWEDRSGLVLITSDHGNLEDLSTRRHTCNQVPALVIGDPELRRNFLQSLHDLSDVAPAILRFLDSD